MWFSSYVRMNINEGHNVMFLEGFGLATFTYFVSKVINVEYFLHRSESQQ